MAATAAYSADVLMSSAGVDANQQQWEYSVPIRQDVRLFFRFFLVMFVMLTICRAPIAVPSPDPLMIPPIASLETAIPRSPGAPPCRDMPTSMTPIT